MAPMFVRIPAVVLMAIYTIIGLTVDRPTIVRLTTTAVRLTTTAVRLTTILDH